MDVYKRNKNDFILSEVFAEACGFVYVFSEQPSYI